MRHPSHPEAIQLLATLRSLFPSGEADPTVMATLAELLTGYDADVVARAFNRLMYERPYPNFPTWAQIQEMLAAESPSVAAWTLVEKQLAAKANTPPLWDDPDTAPAVVRLGGWTVLLEWDGSMRTLRDSFIEAHDQHRWQRERDQAGRPQLGSGITKRLNLSGTDWCEWCADSGWVDLAGTVVERGVRYERGVSACRWCEAGEAVYRSVTTPRRERAAYWPGVRVTTDYQDGDVIPAGGDGVAVSAREYAASPAGQMDAALREAAVREMIGVA